MRLHPVTSNRIRAIQMNIIIELRMNRQGETCLPILNRVSHEMESSNYPHPTGVII